MTSEAAPPARRAPAGHWLSHTRHRPSPNFGPRPPGSRIDLIVVHSISLPPGVFGGGEIEAHFLVRRDGEVLQFVGCDQRAWHAGASSWQGRDNCNDYAIGIELEGLEGGLFEDAQYAALAELCQRLARRYPIAQVVGHEHVSPGRKLDPGPGFDWAGLRQRLGWPARCFPR